LYYIQNSFRSGPAVYTALSISSLTRRENWKTAIEFNGRDLSPSNETTATGCIVSSGALCMRYDDDDNNDCGDDLDDDYDDDDNNNIDVGTT